MSSLSKTKVRRLAGDLITELEGRLDRPLTLTERRAAFAVAGAPVKAAKRLGALHDELADLAWAGTTGETISATAEVAALEQAFAGAVRCSRCGMGLTDPESVAAGMGPDCRAKGTGA